MADLLAMALMVGAFGILLWCRPPSMWQVITAAPPRLYLWDHRAWPWRQVPSGFVPDTAAFTPANNDRALRFAIMAIKGQPFSYVRVVAQETAEPFVTANNLDFSRWLAHALEVGPATQPYAYASVKGYLGGTEGIPADASAFHGTPRVQSPYVRLINGYQRIVFLPGPVFALIVLTGLVGIILPRRRGAAGRGWGGQPPKCGSPVISVIVLPFGAWFFGL